MSIEKISAAEIALYKKNMDVEKKLPAASNLIHELAAPFMQEAETIAAKKTYSIDADGIYFESPKVQKQTKDSKEVINKNIEILKKNSEKLNALPSLEEYIKISIKKGKTESVAIQEYTDKLMKFVHNKKEILELSDEQLLEKYDQEIGGEN